MTLLYRLIYFLVVHLLLPWLHPVSSKVSRGYQLRKKQNGVFPWLISPRNQQPIWIHCASGEFEYALPLIREIKKNNPQEKIMVTYFTPSYVDKIKAEPLVDFVFPSPWDEPAVIRQFLEHHQPKALLFSRTDVWFEMTRQCRSLKIPVIVFSMTFSKKINLMLRLFYRWRWQFVNQFYVVAQEDRATLQMVLPSARINISGDSRYDQCLYRLSLQKDLPLQILPSERKCVVAGSTWPEDENVLLPVIEKTQSQLRWVVVPHEATERHLKDLENQLNKKQISYCRLSKVTSWSGDNVLIVDRVGYLAEFYKFADASFIGGSFRKQVHSVMESLACGCLTVVGPFYKNNREAQEFSQMDFFPIRVVTSAEELEQTLTHSLAEWTPQLKSQLIKTVQSRAGASAKLFATVHALLRP